MARERMVTRSVDATICSTLCINVQSQTTGVEEIVVSGKFDNPDKLLKAVKKAYDVEGEKQALFIQSTKTERKLYAMPEVKFIAEAIELPPRTKVNEDGTVEEATE